MNRVTHKHVQKACDAYNKALNLKPTSVGYIMWADVRGDGAGYRPNLYTVVNENGGILQCDLKRDTMRKTIRAIDLARVADKSQGWCLIIRAIHERGEVQVIALREIRARGLWLSAEQKMQAGLSREVTV